MSRLRAPSPTEVAVPALAAAATFFTLMSWDGLSENASSYLVPLFWLTSGIAGLGIALRALRVPVLVVPLLQMVAVGLVLHQGWQTGGLLGGWVPTPASVDSVLQVVRRSLESTNQYATPVPAEATIFSVIMVCVGVVVALSVDALATTLRRAPLSGLPLLAAFTVPVTLLDGVSWVVFALTALAFVLLLAAEQAGRLGQWGRNLAGSAAGTIVDAQPREVRLGTLWPTASRIGLAGIGVAVLAPLVLPSGGGLFGSGNGPGIGDGDQVSLDNPFVDIKRDLTRGPDLDLVEVRTDDPAPAYLRLTVLDEYDGTRWRPSERDIPASNRADGSALPIPGLAPATPRTEHAWDIQLTDAFSGKWLPTPYPAASVQADGDWRYDFETLDFVGVGGDGGAGERYQAQGLAVQPDPRSLVTAPMPPRQLLADNTRLPTMPPWLDELASDVTEDASSNFERAVMLQRWFRVEGGFEYSTRPDDGNGIDDLERFLLDEDDGRVGYCEQFSASMALMARSLNIPARVAVGFLSPTPTDGSYVFSAHDLHAWPELYFEGAGWVRFEPTPQDRASEPPAYTTGQVPQPPEGPIATPTATSEQPSAAAKPTLTPEDGNASTGDEGLPAWLPWAGGAVLLGAAAATPRVLRSWARRRRFAGPDPDALVEGAWAEIRATALDLGMGWHDGATLRTRARALAPLLRGSAPGSPASPDSGPGGSERGPLAALQELVLLLERSRYSRSGLGGLGGADVRRLADTVTEALRAAARPKVSRRAEWLPASLWRGGRPVNRHQRSGNLLARGSAEAPSPGTGQPAASELDRVSL